VKELAPSWLGAFGIITLGFLLSELGDKTQLATISLGGHEDSFVGVWLGSTAGMVAADALAIVAGVIAGKRLPARTMALVSAALFVVFGTLALGRAVTLMV
jgi:putative Ca2+/H+ antiporter (TMEM165/GDT1 family)